MSMRGMGTILERLADHAERDDDFAEALAFLADEEFDHDPFARPPEQVLATARRMNTSRIDEQRRALARDSLTTAEVVELIPSISDRKAVDRRRSRGHLLGVKVGNRVYHPTWQFARERGDTRSGLPAVLEALAMATNGPIAAHALMTAPQPELDGRTLAEVLADGDVEQTIAVIRVAGDQS